MGMSGNTQLVMDVREEASEDNWLMSIRKVMQRPDVSRIQIMSWLRSKQKQRIKAESQKSREWSRFMSGYVGSNANDAN